MEPTDEGNHARMKSILSEERQPVSIATSPWGGTSPERFSYTVQLSKARPGEVCNSWLPLTCILAVRGSF